MTPFPSVKLTFFFLFILVEFDVLRKSQSIAKDECRKHETRQKWRGIAAGDPSFHPAECQGIREENQTPQQAVMGYWRWTLP